VSPQMEERNAPAISVLTYAVQGTMLHRITEAT
jgi:hypothetical protein